MKPALRNAAVALLLFAAAVSAVAQQAVPTPRRPANSGPSLEATMQYIQQKLSAIGTVTWTQPRQNTQNSSSGTDEFNVELSQITADSGKCRISHHAKLVRDGQVLFDGDRWFSLKEARDVVIEPTEQYLNRINAGNGQPELVTPAGSVNPPFSALSVRFPNAVEYTFLFLDASEADRTAKAITHAIELCGGGSKVFAVASAIPQQAVPPPPRPADSGPSLQATMQFIQGKLSDIGTVNFVNFVQNTNDNSTFNVNWTEEVTNVVADPATCRVSDHWKAIENGSTTQEVDGWFELRDVDRVIVKPMEQYQSEQDASLGNPNLITTATNPRMTALVVLRPHNISYLFPFTDADMADRVAKALTHAVELCGGGNKEPF